MGTIQQRFEVDQPAAVVYDAVSAPHDVLQQLPGVISAAQISPNLYRVTLGPADAPREVDIQFTHHFELRRVEWRTADGTWSGAVTVEPIGPARTAVGVHADGVSTEHGSPSATTIHDALQAFKRVLQSREIRISHGAGAGAAAAGQRYADSARRYASDWRTAAQSAFTRPTEYPFALMRTFTRQADRLWEQMWRGTPLARLPQMVAGLSWNPDVEVCEQDDQVKICIDVPGVDESLLQVEIDERGLTLRGERQDDRGSDPGRRRSELHYGAFKRRIPLPDGVDADGARAILRNGVLEVRIPRHRREPRRVPVQHAS